MLAGTDEAAVEDAGKDADADVPPDAADVALSELVVPDPSVAFSAAVVAGAGSLVLAPPLSPPPLLRKSVTYQPDPLSWKPAAVTCLA